MTALWVSALYWVIVAVLAAIIFLASNFAGPAGTPTFFGPTIDVIAIGTVTYLVGLITFRRRKRH